MSFRSRVGGCLLVLLMMGGTLFAQWEVTKIGDRDYVTMTSLAQFYGTSSPVKAGEVGGKAIYATQGGTRSLRVKSGSRESLINGVRQWLSFPVVVKDGIPHISRMDVSKVIDPSLRPGGQGPLPTVRTVVLDPGHGGHDKGASSRYGYEKEFALDLTTRVRKRLEKAGLKVVQTRTSDVFIDLQRRPAVAERYDNSIFVSLHFNSAGWKPSANGIEIYALTSRGTPPTGQSKLSAKDLESEAGHANEAASVALANAIYPAMVARTRLFDRGVKRSRFAVLRHAKVPAVLVEGGFLTNPAEAARIASKTWRDRLAEAIAEGILRYKVLAEQRLPPPTVTGYGGSPTTSFLPPD